VPAHETHVACFALNTDGTRIATASEKGTLIRIFDTATGTKLQEVRRGLDKAEIYSLAFNTNSQWLACSSDKGTIHVFALRGQSKAEEKKEKAAASAAAAVASEDKSKKEDKKINPTSHWKWLSPLSSYLKSEWSFAQYRVPDVKSIVCFGTERNSIIVVTAEGMYYKAIFDPEHGGSQATRESYAKFIKAPDE